MSFFYSYYIATVAKHNGWLNVKSGGEKSLLSKKKGRVGYDTMNKMK